MIVATAGHIDHGKTALVRALTGVDTDRLPEEKRRGVSIDIGFAYLGTTDGRVIGFVDVPGHERFVRNMLAGVHAVDFAMLVVAADDGVMPQTIEHLHILDLLGIDRGIAVVTKIDRVAEQRVAEVVAAVRALLAPTALAAVDVLPVSAVSGRNLDRLREALAAAARERIRREDAGRNTRHSIDRVFTIAGRGTVVTGTVVDGAVAPGDRLVLTPGGIEVRVREIQKDGGAGRLAVAGERCALNLTGVDVADVHRGDWVVSPAIHAPTRRLAVRLKLLGTEPQPLRHWTPVHLHLGAADVPARVSIPRGGCIAPGASQLAELVLDRPLAALNADRFIVRDQSATRTIAGGKVVDPFAKPGRAGSPARTARLEALENADPQAALAALLACSPAGVDIGQFGVAFNLTAARTEELVRAFDLVIPGKENRVALVRANIEALGRSVTEALAGFHRKSPQAPGLGVAVLRRQVAPDLSMDAFAGVLRGLAEAGRIEVTGAGARLPGHVATDNPADERLWQAVGPLLEDAGFHVPALREVAAAASIREAVLRDFLYRKARTNEVIRIAGERFCLRETLVQLAAVAQTLARTLPGAEFTAAQFRDRIGVGRTLAIEILECLDRIGITQRVGNVRRMRAGSPSVPGASAATPRPAAPSGGARSGVRIAPGPSGGGRPGSGPLNGRPTPAARARTPGCR